MIGASSASAIPGYTVTARVLHWLIAALVLPMIALGIIIANEWAARYSSRSMTCTNRSLRCCYRSSSCGWCIV
jgi:uncharacterized membrane protein YfcA